MQFGSENYGRLHFANRHFLVNLELCCKKVTLFTLAFAVQNRLRISILASQFINALESKMHKSQNVNL